MTADQFKSALRDLGVTPQRFAEAIRVNRNTVYKWGNDKLPVPHYAAIIVRTAQRFDLTIEDLEGADG